MQIGDPTPGSPEALTLPLTVIQELMGQTVNRNMITTIMTTEGWINIPTISKGGHHHDLEKWSQGFGLHLQLGNRCRGGISDCFCNWNHCCRS